MKQTRPREKKGSFKVSIARASRRHRTSTQTKGTPIIATKSKNAFFIDYACLNENVSEFVANLLAPEDVSLHLSQLIPLQAPLR
jgi:hypothetical protein